MRFTRFFAAALALVPAVQVLAAPASVNNGLSIREPLSPSAQEPASLGDILASARTSINAIKSQLESGDSENPQLVEDATNKLKATFENLMGDLKSLKKAKTDGENGLLQETRAFDLKSWPMVGEAYGVTTDILSVVDQIKAVASAPTAGSKRNAAPTAEGKRSWVSILGSILGGVPGLISTVMSILGSL
ncbi:hypothetical protein FS749_007451 [Ceratobasidium sp. UAMH 11750]|nr:hypothetical protein FS749_007451 [Ceratobasidium sp. UAMH 11750]